MNLTSNGKFKPGNQIAKINFGKEHAGTIIRKRLAESIQDVDGKLLKITNELLNSKSIKMRMFAWKELLKYRLPKTEINKISGEERVDGVRVTIVKSVSDLFKHEDEDEKKDIIKR